MLHQCVVVPLHVALVLSSSIWRLVSVVIDYDSTHSRLSIPGVEYIRLRSVMKPEGTVYKYSSSVLMLLMFF